MNRLLAGLLAVAACVPCFAAAQGALRVPAWTAYLAPDADAVPVEEHPDVAPFHATGATLQWFGAFRRSGTLHARVELRVPSGERVTFTLRVAAEPGGGLASDGLPAWKDTETVVRSVEGRDTTVIVDFADVHIHAPGFTRFVLSAAGRGSSRVGVATLILDGAILAQAHFNADARRNAASVHLRYPTDTTATITGFYNEVTAVTDPVDTYYMATGFARGYFGMQVNSPTERRIIFSVWDAGAGTRADNRSTVATDDQVQLIAKGDGVIAEVFGNEGTGGHSHVVVPWRTGEVQRFFVTAENDRVRQSATEYDRVRQNKTEYDRRSDATIYTGYWYDNDLRRWRLIASFRAPKDSVGLRRLYSFSEDFGGSRGHVVRKARYGPAWVRLANGEWRELTTATFSHDPTGRAQRLDRFMGVENGLFFLQHGGFVTGFTAMGTSFTRPPTAAPPRIELPLAARTP
jgi:hypothetical protein